MIFDIEIYFESPKLALFDELSLDGDSKSGNFDLTTVDSWPKTLLFRTHTDCYAKSKYSLHNQGTWTEAKKSPNAMWSLLQSFQLKTKKIRNLKYQIAIILKLRPFVIFRSLHNFVRLPCNVLLCYILVRETKHCRVIGRNNAKTKRPQMD